MEWTNEEKKGLLKELLELWQEENKIRAIVCEEDVKAPTFNPISQVGILYAPEDIIVNAGQTTYLNTKIKLELPRGYQMHFFPTDNMLEKTPLRFKEHWVDSNFQEEIVLEIENHSHPSKESPKVFFGLPVYQHGDFLIPKNAPIARMIFVKQMAFETIEEKGYSKRK